MSARRFIVALAALALVGCSGSDDDPALVPDSIPDTLVSDDELRDGAFEPNEGGAEPGDPAAPTTAAPDGGAPETTSAPTDATTTVPDDATSTGGTTGSSTATTGGTTTGGATTGGTATGGNSDGSATSTAGAATGSSTGSTSSTASTTGGSDTGASTGGPTTGGNDGSNGAIGSTGEVEALTGKVTIGDEVYAFGFDRCRVENRVTKAQGQSTLDDVPFIVRVTSQVLDLDDDGSSETTIEINVETNPDAEGVFADFYVVGVDSETITTEFDLDFSVTDERIIASGPIRDNNGVAKPASETLPMTLDIRCA